MTKPTTLRVAYTEIVATLVRALGHLGFAPDRAQRCAELFARTTADGVYSHGLNRFPRFARMVRSGLIDANAAPRLITAAGALERWDGQRGPGNLNAQDAMARAITSAREHGIACVALANTNHWMRGGSYGWQAADAGMIAICWTNTLPNLPPWGTAAPLLGNNPLVLALPRASGHVVLDMAMSQFSYGALASYRKRGEPLPVPGGFNVAGELSHDAADIEASRRVLPIGYWKGAGLALLLDLIAGSLSGGNFTRQLDFDPDRETGQSQVFIAINPAAVGAEIGTQVESVIAELHAAAGVRYPGERVLATRRDNMQNGVPVEADVWQAIVEMAR